MEYIYYTPLVYGAIQVEKFPLADRLDSRLYEGKVMTPKQKLSNMKG